VRRTGWLVALGLSAAAAFGGALAFGWSAAHAGAGALGWAIALANGVTAGLMHRYALRFRGARFLAWSAGGALGRPAVTAAVLVGVAWRMGRSASPFLAAALASYAVVLATEIVLLHAAGREEIQHESGIDGH
jgi:hypothetical protein